MTSVKYVQCDVTNFQSQVNFLQEALAFFPRNEVDIYIPNAGVLPPATEVKPADPSELASLTSPPTDLLGRAIDVNLKAVYVGTILVTRYGMGLHKGPSSGRTKAVILIGSLAGYCGAETSDEYTTTKFGVRGLFRGLRKQAASLGVRLNLVAPFYAETPMTVVATPILKSIGMPMVTVDQVVNAVSILATDEDIWGRSLMIMPDSLSDGGDDSQGGQGGKSFSTQAFGEHWAVLINGPMSDEIAAS